MSQFLKVRFKANEAEKLGAIMQEWELNRSEALRFAVMSHGLSRKELKHIVIDRSDARVGRHDGPTAASGAVEDVIRPKRGKKRRKAGK